MEKSSKDLGQSIYFYNVLNLIPGGKKHIIKPTNGSRDIHGLLQKSKINLQFTDQGNFTW